MMTLAVLGWASLAAAADPVTLRYKFAADESIAYQNTMKLTQSVSVVGQQFETTMDTDELAQRKVLSVAEDGAAQLETSKKHFKVRGDFGPAGKFSFDSTSEEKEEGTALAPILNPTFETMSNMVVRFTVAPRGEITGVEGYDEAMQQILKDNPMGAAFAGGGDADAFAQSMADAYPQLPEAAVRPGDTWEQPYEMKNAEFGEIQGKRILKLISVDEKDGRQIAEIGLTHQLNGNLDIKVGEARVTGKITIGASEGTILFDVEAGRILSNKFKLSTTSDLVTIVGDQTIDTDVEQTQEVELKLVESAQ
jgi:hypothetical protein